MYRAYTPQTYNNKKKKSRKKKVYLGTGFLLSDYTKFGLVETIKDGRTRNILLLGKEKKNTSGATVESLFPS